MSALGSLVVKLALEYAEYTKGLDKSSQEALKFAQNTQKHFDKANEVTHEFFTGVVKGAAATAAAYIGVSGAVDMFNESIDNLASLDDMAQKTGATVENLSRMQKVAVMTGTDFGNVDGAVVKLAKNMAGIDDESNKTFKALELLGVSSTDTAGKLRDPAEVLIDVAKGLQSYEDGAAKVSIANDLFGKSGADLLPYLNDVNENVDRFTGVSTEAAQKASEMQDRFGALKVQADELKTEFSMALLPAFNDISGAIIDTYKESGKLEAAWIALGGLGTFLFTDDFASDKQKLAELNDELKSMEIDMKLRQESFGVNGALKRLLFGGYSMEELPKAIEYTRYQIGLLQDKIKSDASPKTGTKSNIDLGKSRAEEEAEKEAKARADRLKRDQESQIKQREKFIEGLEKEAATLSMTAAQSKVYEAAQIGITGRELDKVKALTRSIEAHKANEKAIADELKISQEHAAQNLEFSNSLDKNVDALRSQVEAQRDYNERLGLSQSAIRSLNSEEIERQAIAKESLASLMDQIDWTGQLGDKYREEARLLRELNALKNEGIDTQNGIDRVNQSLREQSDMWASIDRTAHDTFISMWDSGKETAQRLKDTFKNVFFDWLYQMTVKKWIVNVSAGFSGDVSGATGAGGGISSLSSMYSAGKAMWDGFSLAGTIGGGIGQLGSLFGSTSMSAFASGMSGTAAGTFAGAGPTLAGSASGLGAMAGTGGTTGVLSSGAGSAAGAAGAGSSAAAAIPIVGWVLAGMMANNSLYDKGWGEKLDDKAKYSGAAAGMVGGLFTDSIQRIFGLSDKTASMLSGSAVVNRLFGNKRAELQQSEISGSFGAGGYTANQRDVFKAEGGLFSGDKWSEKNNAVSNAKAMTDVFMSIKEAAAGYASQLGLSTKELETFSKDFKFNLSITGDAAKDAAANEKLFNDLIGGLADDISTVLAPSIKNFAKDGETASATLARLSIGLSDVNAQVSAMGFAKFDASIAGASAAQKLVDASGGQQNFAAGTSFFTQNFLSEADRMKPVIESLATSLESLGYSSLKTVEDFKLAVVGGVDASGNLVKGLDLTTDAGTQTFAQMIALAPQFKLVADYTEELNGTLSQTTEALNSANDIEQERIGIQAQINALTMSAAEALNAQRNAINEANRSEWDRLQLLQQSRAQERADAELASQIAAERAGLQNELNQLTMTGAELAELKRAEYYKQNLDLYDQVAALRNQSEQAQIAEQSLERANDAAEKLSATWQSLADSMLDEVNRIRGDLFGNDSAASLASAQATFGITQAQAMAGDQDAAKLLPKLSQTLLSIAEQQAPTVQALNSIRVLTADSLEKTGKSYSKYGVKLPSFAVGTDYVPDDMIAQIHKGERIVPAAFNDREGATQAQLIAEVISLRLAVESLLPPTINNEKNTSKMKDNIERVTRNGSYMNTEKPT